MIPERRRDRPERSHNAQKQDSTETYQIGRSVITVERGPAGPVARIERAGQSYTRDYAGPLPAETLAAIREVSKNV